MTKKPRQSGFLITKQLGYFYDFLLGIFRI